MQPHDEGHRTHVRAHTVGDIGVLIASALALMHYLIVNRYRDQLAAALNTEFERSK